MIHRAPFGSMERFVAVLLEHTGGKLPLWLTSEQVAVLTISDKYLEYAEKVLNELRNCDIRAFIDERSEKVGRKIRDAEVRKVPYMLVLGEKEEAEGVVSVRRQGEGGDLGAMSVEAFAEIVRKDVRHSLKLN
jgi:threonyl-tRNA synthetase